MQRRFRKGVWLAAVALVIPMLLLATALAHEGRAVGDYRLVVGWQAEPAYESARNAISVRVNKVTESATAAHGGENGHDSGHSHQHDGLIEAGSAMSVAAQAELDPVSGVNVRVIAEGLTFSPESVNGEHRDGEGHAHIYVDGVKLNRVYTPWLHLDGLAPGRREIRVTLNANSHEVYAWNGAAVETITHVTVPEPGAGTHHHGPETIEAESPMSVALHLEADPLGGANLFIETGGIAFAPQNAGLEHIAGEGHAHIYVNGVKVSRLYGHAFLLDRLAEGMNEVRVTLNANTHQTYTRNGEPVAAAASIHIPPGMGGAGYGGHPTGDGHDHDHGESAPASPTPAADDTMSGVTEEYSDIAPVEGLEGSLRVEVTHTASGASRTLDLYAVFDDPGHYAADLIPTAAGVYEFRVFGTIEGMPLDETFVSQGGGGDFDDIVSSAELQFPEQLPELREMESGLRGALTTAQQAQDAALAAQQDSGGNTLAVVALIVGIVGVVIAGIAFVAGAVWPALRRQES